MPNQSISEAPTFFSNFEFEDEREQENEAFSNSEYEQGAYFIGEIAKVAKSIAKEAKRYAPSVVQALLKLIPKTLSPDASPGKLSYAMIQEGEMEVAQKQSEFFGSNELEVEVSDHEVAHEAALTEFFADQAAEAATESEAEFLIGATLPMTTSIKAGIAIGDACDSTSQRLPYPPVDTTRNNGSTTLTRCSNVRSSSDRSAEVSCSLRSTDQ